MRYEQCDVDPTTWIKDCEEHCECIVACVNDLMIASKDPQGIACTLINTHCLTLRELALFLIISDAILEKMKIGHCTSDLENTSRR